MSLEKLVQIVERYHSFFLNGVLNTLVIAAFSVLLGVVLGTLMAMLRMGRVKLLPALGNAYIEFIRGTPLMVQLMFMFYLRNMTVAPVKVLGMDPAAAREKAMELLSRVGLADRADA